MKTRTELDEIKRLKAENRRLKERLADEVVDHGIDEAALNPDVRVIEFLLSKGALLGTSSMGCTELGVALAEGTPERMKYFMDRGEDLDEAMEREAYRAPLENIRFALENGYDPNRFEKSRDGDPRTKVVGFHWNTYNNNQRFNYSTGNVISVRKVKYSDDSWEVGEEQVITIANADLHNCGGGWYRMSQGYLYWVSRDNTSIYIINMSNTADVRKIEVAGANESQIRINDALRSSIKGDGVVFGYTFRVPDDTTDYVRWGIIHHDGLMTKSAATGGQTYDVWDKQPVYKILGVSSARRWSYPYYYRSDITLMAAYLGTINNLSSPIVKTASQTMKVTYTLTDLEEDDDE